MAIVRRRAVEREGKGRERGERERGAPGGRDRMCEGGGGVGRVSWSIS